MAKTRRKLSKFNIFMKSEIKRVKKMHPSMSHQAAFKMAAQNWKSQSHSGSNHVSTAHKSKKRHKKK